MLKQEYDMRSKIDHFEKSHTELKQDLERFSVIEFYHEENKIKKQIEVL
jgi:hypothetical protein